MTESRELTRGFYDVSLLRIAVNDDKFILFFDVSISYSWSLIEEFSFGIAIYSWQHIFFTDRFFSFCIAEDDVTPFFVPFVFLIDDVKIKSIVNVHML